MANIKKGDLVQVIIGPTQARGGTAASRAVSSRSSSRRTGSSSRASTSSPSTSRSARPSAARKTGGIETHEAPIHISNVAARRPEDQEADPRRIPRRGRREGRRQEDRSRSVREEVRREALNGNRNCCDDWPHADRPAAPEAEVPQRDHRDLTEEFELHERPPGSRAREDRRQHRRRRGRPRLAR